MSKPSKLADPNGPIVRDALMRVCPICGAQPHVLCRSRDDKPLVRRVVHFGRVKFREPAK